MMFEKRPTLVAALLPAVILLAGCGGVEKSEPKSPPKVTVAEPVQKSVVVYQEFTGKTEAVETVDVRARVQGYLDKINFKPSSIVKKGDLLFVIETAPYQARLDEAKAKLAADEAALKLAQSNLDRAAKLVQSKTVTIEEFNTKTAERDTAAAAILGSKAAIELAQIQFDYTHIHAPITGRIGRWRIDAGNLVGVGSDTLLTTIVQIDPIYAYFDIPEKTLLAFLKWRRENPNPKEKAVVDLALANEKGYPHQGELDYLDNKIDPSTGTLLVRGIFPNKDGYLYAGAFARVRLPSDTLKGAILVHEEALGADLGGKFLLVVNGDNIVEHRPVETGALVDGMRVITEGLAPEERYILKGLQRARPGQPVTPELASPEKPSEMKQEKPQRHRDTEGQKS